MRNTIKLLLLAGLIAFSACKKGDDPDPMIPAETGTMLLHLHTYLENNEVSGYNLVYTTEAGRKISLSLAQLYLSHIKLVRADGSLYEVAGKKVLQELGKETYSLGEVPVGEYKSITFHVGFDATANQAAPSTDPALLDRPEMWFGAAPQPDGYVFIHVAGKIDPTADASGSIADMVPFEYKLGTSNMFVEISMPEETFIVEKDKAGFVHLLVDYAKIFNGLPWHSASDLSVLTAADNAHSPATWIVNNIDLMFRYEE